MHVCEGRPRPSHSVGSRGSARNNSLCKLTILIGRVNHGKVVIIRASIGGLPAAYEAQELLARNIRSRSFPMSNRSLRAI